MIPALATLLVFQLLGEALVFALAAPVPGPVVGLASAALTMAWLMKRVAPAPQPVDGEQP